MLTYLENPVKSAKKKVDKLGDHSEDKKLSLNRWMEIERTFMEI